MLYDRPYMRQAPEPVAKQTSAVRILLIVTISIFVLQQVLNVSFPGIGGRQNGGEWKKHCKGAQGERVDHNKDPIGDPAPVFLRPRTARGQMFNAG